MPKKTNAKKEEGQARKEATKAEKQSKIEKAKQQAEDAQWEKGAKPDKSSKDAEKKAEMARKKAEKEELMRQEEAENAKISAKTKKIKDKDQPKSKINVSSETKSYAASGLDDALELMTVSTENNTEKLDRHPERRVKAALAVYTEKRMPGLRKENPGLKLSQLNEVLYKEWKKSPENPMNQVHASYNTKASEMEQAVKVVKEDILAKYEQK